MERILVNCVRSPHLSNYLSKNCTPLIDAIPMYKKTPNNTDIGIRRKRGAIATERPTMMDTKRPEIRCSLTSVM
jgi:hypothetical protein